METPFMVCAVCAVRVERSERNARHHRQHQMGFTCDLCRRPAPKLTEAERRKLEAWWRDRHTASELREMAGALWS